jgi:hypothetical protein
LISRNNKFGQNSSFVADEMYDLVQQEFIKRNELRSASKAGEQAEFDKDIFTKLVDLVKIKSREDIIFILKDGTEVRAGIM